MPGDEQQSLSRSSRGGDSVDRRRNSQRPSSVYQPKCGKCSAIYCAPPVNWDCAKCKTSKCWQVQKVAVCCNCEKPFGAMWRRHHCRVCGYTFCARCSAFRSCHVPWDSTQHSVRACHQCSTAESQRSDVPEGDLLASAPSAAFASFGSFGSFGKAPSLLFDPSSASADFTGGGGSGEDFGSADLAAAPSISRMRHWLRLQGNRLVARSSFRSIDALDGYLLEHLAKPAVAAKVAEYGLSDDEAIAVVLYTVDCPEIFAKLNRLLRAQEGDAEAQKELALYQSFAFWLTSGMSRLPQFCGVVFRALNTKDVTSEYHSQRDISYPQFTSCATHLSKKQLDVFGRENGALLALDVVGARHISSLSVFPDEAEVVLLPGWGGTVLGSLNDPAKRFLDDLGLLGNNIKIQKFTVIELAQMGTLRASEGKCGVLVHSAASDLKHKMEKNPRDAESRVSYGMLLMDHLRDRSGAKEYFQRALELDPSNVAGHTSYALLLMLFEQDNSGAKEHYERAIELDPKYVNARINFAVLLKNKLHDYQAAKVHFEAALELNEKNAGAHINYAMLLADHLDEFDAAKKHYERAIELNPNFAGGHFNLANLLLKDHFRDYAAAKVHYEHALKINPNHAPTRIAYAKLLEDHFQEHGRARDNFEQALKLEPNDAATRGRYADLLRERFSDNQGARDNFEQSLKINSRDATTQSRYASLLADHYGEKGDAKKNFEQALKTAPDDAVIRTSFADFLKKNVDQESNVKLLLRNAAILGGRLHDSKGARQLYDRAIEVDPNNANSHASYAMLLRAHFQDHDRAKEHYLTALKLNSNDANVHASFAELLHEHFQDHDGAKEHYLTALKLNSNDANVHASFAELLRDHFQDRDGAKEHFFNALVLNPNDADAKASYAALM